MWIPQDFKKYKLLSYDTDIVSRPLNYYTTSACMTYRMMNTYLINILVLPACVTFEKLLVPL